MFLNLALLEKLLNFNVFLLFLSFNLFLNIYVDLRYDFSLISIKSYDIWKSKEIDVIDWIYVFSFYCLFITGGMHFFRYSVGSILAETGLLSFFIKDKEEGKVHIDEYHRFSIKFNNMAAFNTYKDRLKEKNKIEKMQILCQSIAILIFVTYAIHGFTFPYSLTSEINSLNFELYILVNLIGTLLAAFIIPMSIQNFDFLSYVDKSLIKPFLDEEDELKKIKIMKDSKFYEL